MKLLFLDDDDFRHRRFAQWCSAGGFFDTTHVYDVPEFEQAITWTKFDVVFLDHDLVEFDDQGNDLGPSKYDGRDAVKLLCALDASFRPDLVIVHSMNPAAAQQMMFMLKDAGFNAVRKMFDPNDPNWLSLKNG